MSSARNRSFALLQGLVESSADGDTQPFLALRRADWPIPAVSAAKGVIRFDQSRIIRRRAPEPLSLVIPFSELADSSDDEITVFARKWGPLGLCVHRPRDTSPRVEYRWPATHNDYDFLPPYPGQSFCRPTMSEPIERWREIAAETRSLATIATYLRDPGGPPPPHELWRAARIVMPGPVMNTIEELPGRSPRVVSTRHYPDVFMIPWRAAMAETLASSLSWWLRSVGLRPIIVAGKSHLFEPEIGIAWGWRLLPTVIWDLALAASGAREIGRCKNPKCGRIFARTAENRKYCGRDCGGSGRRLASYYASGREARRSKLNSTEKASSRQSRLTKARKGTGKRS